MGENEEMSDFVLSCCSTADLSKEHFEAIDVKYICFHYELDGVTYLDDLGQSIPFNEFYAKMAAGAETKTSQVNADEFADYFRPFLEQGLDILHVCLSSGITGVINSANIAKGILEEEFPNRKIYIVDSLGASSGYGLIMDTMAQLRDQGMTIDELYNWIEENKLRMHHWFFSTDLSFYIKGGRISKTAGAIGQLLSICPLLNMDNLGRLIPRYKIRTKKKSSRQLLIRWKNWQMTDWIIQENAICVNLLVWMMQKRLQGRLKRDFQNLMAKWKSIILELRLVVIPVLEQYPYSSGERRELINYNPYRFKRRKIDYGGTIQ